MSDFRHRPVALVTGASGGIGYELAKLLADDGYDLAISARDGAKLADAGERIATEHGVNVESLPVDLSRPGAAAELYDRLEGAPLEVLINNAGYGTFGMFSDTDVKATLGMIRLNVEALTHLTRLALPAMIERGEGRILNVASTAAFQPGPLMAVYYATKAYVLHFSEALSEELRDTGVTATALCPGPTTTGFQSRAAMEESGLMRNVGTMDAADVARAGYRALVRGDPLVIPGARNRLTAFSVRFAPRRVTPRIVRQLQK